MCFCRSFFSFCFFCLLIFLWRITADGRRRSWGPRQWLKNFMHDQQQQCKYGQRIYNEKSAINTHCFSKETAATTKRKAAIIVVVVGGGGPCVSTMATPFHHYHHGHSHKCATCPLCRQHWIFMSPSLPSPTAYLCLASARSQVFSNKTEALKFCDTI